MDELPDVPVEGRLVVTARGAIIEIAFDHPPINVYDVAARDELCDTLAAVIADPDVRVVVFRAIGDHFSAGADLAEFGTAPSLWAMRDTALGRDVWGLLRAVEVPMIASMHGYAVGFGFELALHCDVRIASDDCVLALPEAAIGMIPAGSEPDVAAARGHRARRCTRSSTAERIPAGRALEQGFVDDVVARHELRAFTSALADRVAARPAAAVRAAKAAVWSALDLPLAVGLSP